MKARAKTIECECGGVAAKTFVSRIFTIGGLHTEVNNIPAFVCEKCHEIYFDGPSILEIERKLERETIAA